MGNIYLLSEESKKAIGELMSLGVDARKKLKMNVFGSFPMLIFSNIESDKLGFYDRHQNLIVLERQTCSGELSIKIGLGLDIIAFH